MPAKPFFRRVGKQIIEVLGVQTSAGAANGGDIVALDDTGRLHSSMMPSGIGADTTTAPASEALAAGNFVNEWNDAGTVRVRKADATSYSKRSTGFVLEAVALGATATIHHEGTNTALTGLTPGEDYVLSETPGAVSLTEPAAPTANKILQHLGHAPSATSLSYEPDQPIVLA